MRVREICVGCGAAVALVSIIASNVFAQTAVRSAIDNANKQFTALSMKADAAGIARLYAADARAFPPGGDVVTGRMAIQQMWKSVFDSGVGKVEVLTQDVEASGDLATESGNYVITAKDGKVADRGKYNVVWKRVGGQWQLYRDIWNTSMAPTSTR
jgi:uncharacterized protein (TIGR02246 family)